MFIKPRHSLKDGKTTRMIRMHNVQSFDVWLKSMKIYKAEKDYNLYYSLAKYKDGIPHGSLNLSDRDFGNWKQDHWKKMTAYDFLLDIDAGNHKEMEFAFESAKHVKVLFDKLEVPYNLRFSGMGFHFIIPYLYFTALYYDFEPESEFNIYQFYMNIATELKKRYSEMIDDGIYDSRRVTKIPYSIALYDSKEYICYPFATGKEFNDFKISEMQPRNKLNVITSVNKINEHIFNENGNVYKLLALLKV